MRKLLLSLGLLLLAPSTKATNFNVKAGGGGDFTTIQACANGMASGDSCTVFAGTYNEGVTVPAGAVNLYKTITVNGSDIVSVLSFTLGSHTKLIGNCPEKQGTVTTATCGFFIANTANPKQFGSCVGGSGVTDIYVRDVVLFACGSGSNVSFTGGSSFVFIQGVTLSYPSITPGTISGCPNDVTCTGNGMLLIGNHFLVENCDLSHYTLGVDLNASQLIVRNSIFHDQKESEAHGNGHTDAWFSEPGPPPGGLVSQFNVYEGNTQNNGVGPNAKMLLAQNDEGSSACAGQSCKNLIERFNIVSAIGSGVNSPNEVNSWPFWKDYNNTFVDTVDGGGTNGVADNKDSQTNSANLNVIYYFSSLGSGNTIYTCGSGCSRGNNLFFCVGSCPSVIFSSDPGNKNGIDPKFVNYSGVGNAANNYHLQTGSPAIGAGTNLTTVASTDSGLGTSLVVSDAAYFQDGYGLSNTFSSVNSDCIAVNTASNNVCITAVNYTTNTLTLASSITRSSGQPVYLYRKSDGVQVLTGSLPDIGALPFGTPTSGASFSPTSVAFPNQVLGTTSFPSTIVTLTNSGSAVLNLTSIVISGTNAADFAIDGPNTTCPLGVGTLAVAASCNIALKFSPTLLTLENANLVATDDAPGSPQTVPLSGTGVTVNTISGSATITGAATIKP